MSPCFADSKPKRPYYVYILRWPMDVWEVIKDWVLSSNHSLMAMLTCLSIPTEYYSYRVLLIHIIFFVTCMLYFVVTREYIPGIFQTTIILKNNKFWTLRYWRNPICTINHEGVNSSNFHHPCYVNKKIEIPERVKSWNPK